MNQSGGGGGLAVSAHFTTPFVPSRDARAKTPAALEGSEFRSQQWVVEVPHDGDTLLVLQIFRESVVNSASFDVDIHRDNDAIRTRATTPRDNNKTPLVYEDDSVPF